MSIEREHEALKLRYKALSDDWNRHRDVAFEWRRFQKWVFWAAVGVMVLGASGILTGTI